MHAIIAGKNFCTHTGDDVINVTSLGRWDRSGRIIRIRLLPLLAACLPAVLVDAIQGRPAVPVHVHSESLLTPELLLNTCNRTKTSSTSSTLRAYH